MLPNNILFSDHIAEIIDKYFRQKKFTNIGVLVDESTLLHCYPRIARALPMHFVIEIPSGEENKTLQTCEKIWSEMTDHEMDRKSLLINLGGGVICDMGGFCAATFKRGVSFIQIPTTLLAQVDASVGGKLGIDFKDYKNHIGLFQEATSNWIDIAFLETLEERELLSGFAEVLKHCLIADQNKWEAIINNDSHHLPLLERFDWEKAIYDSIVTKTKIVQSDPYEKGLRKILNFGHTLGHALESYFLSLPGRKLLHGEAVVIGMVCESYLSYSHQLINKSELETICNFLLQYYRKVSVVDDDILKIIEYTKQDKKNQNNQVMCTLLEGIGKASYNHPIQQQEMTDSLYFYKEFSPKN